MTAAITELALATVLLALSPGPDNIYVLTQSVSRGSVYGMVTVLGLMTGCVIHTSIVALGLGFVIRDTPTVFWAIKILGATYLIYLAYRAWRSRNDVILSEDKKDKLQLNPEPKTKFFKVGLTMNLLNPKVTLFFLALLPGFVTDDALAEWVQLYIFGGVFILVSAVIFFAVCLLGGQISNFLKGNAWFGRVISYLQVIVFLAIATVILW